jgi:hypothetical protein
MDNLGQWNSFYITRVSSSSVPAASAVYSYGAAIVNSGLLGLFRLLGSSGYLCIWAILVVRVTCLNPLYRSNKKKLPVLPQISYKRFVFFVSCCHLLFLLLAVHFLSCRFRRRLLRLKFLRDFSRYPSWSWTSDVHPIYTVTICNCNNARVGSGRFRTLSSVQYSISKRSDDFTAAKILTLQSSQWFKNHK